MMLNATSKIEESDDVDGVSDDSSLHDFLQSLSGSSKAKSPLRSAENVPAPDKLEICGFNLRGKCNYGEKCNARHTTLPYLWEYSGTKKGTSQLSWYSFEDDQNKKIEEAFCNCAESQIYALTKEKMRCLVDFPTLTGKLRQTGRYFCVNRLESTNLTSQGFMLIAPIIVTRSKNPGHDWSCVTWVSSGKLQFIGGIVGKVFVAAYISDVISLQPKI